MPALLEANRMRSNIKPSEGKKITTTKHTQKMIDRFHSTNSFWLERLCVCAHSAGFAVCVDCVAIFFSSCRVLVLVVVLFLLLFFFRWRDRVNAIRDRARHRIHTNPICFIGTYFPQKIDIIKFFGFGFRLNTARFDVFSFLHHHSTGFHCKIGWCGYFNSTMNHIFFLSSLRHIVVDTHTVRRTTIAAQRQQHNNEIETSVNRAIVWLFAVRLQFPIQTYNNLSRPDENEDETTNKEFEITTKKKRSRHVAKRINWLNQNVLDVLRTTAKHTKKANVHKHTKKTGILNVNQRSERRQATARYQCSHFNASHIDLKWNSFATWNNFLLQIA